jgi:hypothetical protein
MRGPKPKPFTHPCQLLLHRQKLGIKQRDEVWPRDEFQNREFKFNLKNEFLAIIEKAIALKNEKGELLPKLSEIKVVFQDDDQSHTVSAADWILYGETQISLSQQSLTPSGKTLHLKKSWRTKKLGRSDFKRIAVTTGIMRLMQWSFPVLGPHTRSESIIPPKIGRTKAGGILTK